MRTLVLRSDRACLDAVGAVAPPPALAIALVDTLQSAGVGVVGRSRLTGGVHPQQWSSDIKRQADRLLDEQPDVALMHAVDVLAAATALAARSRSGAGVIVRAQFAGLAPRADSPLRTLWPVVLRAANAVLAPTAQDARTAIGLGAPAARVVLCPDAALLNSEDCAQSLTDEPQTEPNSRPPAPDAPYLLGLSGAPDRSWVRTELVSALVQDVDLRLVIASPSGFDRQDRHRLLALAEAHGVRGRVVLVGHLPTPELLAWVDRTAMVVATRPDPTCGLATLTAMRRGRPVIAVPSASADDVLVDGVTGHLAGAGRNEMSQAICALSRDSFRQVAWGVAGRERALARFAPDTVLRSMLSAYEISSCERSANQRSANQRSANQRSANQRGAAVCPVT